MEPEGAPDNAGLVRRLRAAGHIRTPAVERAFLAVDRRHFVSDPATAYVDTPIPIGEGQTISAPHMVAIMIEALELSPNLSILEVGGGSGYHAAIVSEIVAPAKVVSVELVPALATAARANLSASRHEHAVEVVVADGSLGYPARAPYDRVSVACAAPSIPRPILDQLRPGGMALLPVGNRGEQRLIRARVTADGSVRREDLGGCMFVPLRGVHGFQ